MKILVINGANMNMLGIREPDIYGRETLADLEKYISDNSYGAQIDFFQSNIEGEIINEIHSANTEYDGIVINPGAYTHYSVAIADALRAVSVPAVEVHISNIFSREDYRSKSVTGNACKGVISGFGFYGYVIAIEAIVNAKKN